MTAVDPQASKICLSCEGVSATDADRCPHCAAPLLPLSSVHFPSRRGEVDAGNPMVGSVVGGKFVLKGVLGKGGMGTVFRASHAVSLAPVAVKLLHPRWSSRAEFRRSLLAEARKAGRVVHEHCARVLDVGEAEDGTVYLAMELADGEPVDALVRRGGVAPSIAVDILAQVARALVAIHATGLVHRDLSSRNVLVAWRAGAPFVKVLDFGIAQTARLPVGGRSDEGGDATFANPVFSAPEQLAGGEVDARADLYSLGVLAFLLLTGQLLSLIHI
jgi:serine/threonine protein kinase